MLDADKWKQAMQPKITDGIKTIQSQMHNGDETKNDDWYAAQLGALLADVISSTGTDQIKTAAIPPGSVIIAVGGGSGAPATGTPNPDEIPVE